MPGSDPNSSSRSPAEEQRRPESWAADPISPRSHAQKLSFGQTSAPSMGLEGSDEGRAGGKKPKHRPSLSKFTFPARQSAPTTPTSAKRTSTSTTTTPTNFFNYNGMMGDSPLSPTSVPRALIEEEELGPTDIGLGLSEEDMLPRPASTGDLSGELGGEIQFKAPFRRPSVRTLYSSALVQSSRFAADPGYGSRKQSMVNPEDYRPGMSGGVGAGKAMTAGFDAPPLPDVTSRILEARASLAGERKASWYPITDFGRSTPATTDSARALKALSQHVDADLGDMAFHDQDDDASDKEWDRESPELDQPAAMPTMYSNTFLGPLSVSSDEKSSAPFDRRPSTVPRDPVTGKVDWRARLQMKPRHSVRASISLESGSNGKNSPYASGQSTPLNEKNFTEKFVEKYVTGKPSPNIIQLDNEKYTSLGRFLLRLSPLTFIISFVATNFYLYLRAQSILHASKATGNPFISAWLFYGFEWVFASWAGFRAIQALFSMNFQAKPRLLLQGDFALPNVDVLVLSTGQDPGMVIDAVVAAARLDWPVDKLRVLVIDETRSEVLKYQVEQYSSLRAVHVTYHQRSQYAKAPRGGVWPKSSTINLGLSETRAEGRIAGQYAVILEAESICEPGMLRALLPHMVLDPLLSLVQSPSAFYNLPKTLSSTFSAFMNFVEPVGDSRSAFAVRRTAVDDIGGFPTRSSIEDKRLELIMKGKGYSTLFLDEPLAFSVVPDSFSKHLGQRVNRILAHFKTAARLNFFIWSPQIAHLSFKDRLSGLSRAFRPFFSIIITLACIALPVSLALGGFLVPALSVSELNTMLWAALAMILAERLHDFCSYMPNGEASTRSFVRTAIFTAPYLVLGLVRSMIPSFLCRAPQPYWQESKQGERLERNPKYRKSFFGRILSVTLGTHGWTHLLLISGTLGAIGYALYDSTVAYAKHQRGLHQTALFVLMTVAWPTLPWMDLLLGSFMPFVYAISPPAVPSREALLHREPISGRATPLEHAKSLRPFRTRFWGQAFLSVLTVAYACAVFSLTFVDLHIN